MSARFQWTDGGAQSFVTVLKLQQQTYAHNRPAFVVESIDGSVVEAVVVGSGQNQIRGFIRHETDQASLRDLASALRRRLSMTFTPDNDVPGTTFTVTAVGEVPNPVQEAEGRQDLFALGPITLRRLDGGAFEPT